MISDESVWSSEGMDVGYYVSDLANKSMSGIYVKHVIYKHQNGLHQCECTRRLVMGTW